MPKRVVIFILSLSLIFYASFRSVVADLGTCSVSVSPTTLTNNTDGEIVFSVSNTGNSSIMWLKVTSPSTAFVMNAIDGPSNIGETSIASDGSSATIILSGINVGDTADYNIGLHAGDTTSSSSFVVQASDSQSGDSAVTCSGSTSVSIVSGGQSGVNISGLTVSVSDSSAVFGWSTSVGTTSQIQYGRTSGYGSTSTSGSSTSHSVTISSLSSNTTYHYKITSTDGTYSSNTGDRTFTTGTTGSTVVTSTVTNIVREVLKDLILPSIKVKTSFKKIYEDAPTVDVVASDNSGITRVEYSIDNGRKWTAIDIEDDLGDKKVELSFTPNISDDGDYTLLIRATDTTGNKSQSKGVKYTIDRLSPRISPLVVMAGPLIIHPNSANSMDLLIGVEYRFIVSVAGGPNKVWMTCGDNVYDFIQNSDIGIWITRNKFTLSGECVPKIKAEDGAGNKHEVIGNKFLINELGKLNGVVTVYWYDDYNKKFVVWDGLPYGQNNPIETAYADGYGFVLPAGKYYLEAKSVGKRTGVSNIIDTKETVMINDDWKLSPAWKFWPVNENKIIHPKVLGNNNWTDVNFKLPETKLSGISTLDVRGNVSIVSLTNSWHPETSEMLSTLNSLYDSKMSVYPILVYEKDFVSKIVKRKGFYGMPIFADPDGNIVNNLEMSGLPITWIVDRFGQVVKSKVGQIKYQDVIDIVSKID